MKPKIPFFIIAFISLILVACDEPEPTPTPFPEAIETSEPTHTPIPPTSTPLPKPTAVPSPTAEPTATETPVPENLAEIVNDEGGVVNITGVVTYTNPFFTLGVAAPVLNGCGQTGDLYLPDSTEKKKQNKS